MKKCIFLITVLMSFFATSSSSALELSYESFSSIQEVIDFETAYISHLARNDYEQLSEALIARAESFLIAQQFENALTDLNKAYELSRICKDHNAKQRLEFRSLFDMIIIYANLEMEKEAIEISDYLHQLIITLQCENCQDKHSNLLNMHSSTCLEIQGPNYNMPGWCEEVVVGTAGSMKLLASYAKSKKIAVALVGIIEALEMRCLKCCASGEFWKTCVAPIVEKWKQWNDKWVSFGIPPDPAWD